VDDDPDAAHPIDDRDGQDTGSPAEQSVPPGDPTSEAHLYWSRAFDFWNNHLFGGKLPKVMITLSRKARVMGYYRPNAMENLAGAVIGQIALNPEYFHLGDKEAHATLVHEMTHCWRQVIGPPNAKRGRGSRGYHDRIWADRMEEIGLMPSSTGRPGGKRTGYSVAHYPIPGSRFERLFDTLTAEMLPVDWRDHACPKGAEPVDPLEPILEDLGVVAGDRTGDAEEGDPPAKPKDRIKFSCACGLNAWAKPSAKLVCGFCTEPMVPAHPTP